MDEETEGHTINHRTKQKLKSYNLHPMHTHAVSSGTDNQIKK